MLVPTATKLPTHLKLPRNWTLLPYRPLQYYPYVNNVSIDARGLLEQGLQDFGLDKFRWLNGVAKNRDLALRISETNSL